MVYKLRALIAAFAPATAYLHTSTFTGTTLTPHQRTTTGKHVAMMTPPPEDTSISLEMPEAPASSSPPRLRSVFSRLAAIAPRGEPKPIPGSSSAEKRVFLLNQGSKDMKLTLGGKGANLCEMARLGLPVPPAFIISTASCLDYFKQGGGLPTGLADEYLPALAQLERETGKVFGDPSNPLLVSVRSGAPASMPGMLDTVLNLGLNDEIVAGIIRKTGNPRFAYDTYRRFIQMFSNVVMGMGHEPFSEVVDEIKKARGYRLDVEMTADDWKEVVRRFKLLNPGLPTEPHDQLKKAIEAVFKSWYNPRAIRYRAYNNIPATWGTAVNVQAMVFGNMNDACGTGVAFSRNPSTGENYFFGEFLSNAAGEDVVAGIRTPQPLSEMAERWPEIYAELDGYQRKLENYYRDMQDLEFTIENGRLYMLQTRNGKRTPAAAVRIAVDMVKEGMLTQREALLRIPAEQMDFFLHSSIDPKAAKSSALLGKGLPASPGAATGKIVFTADAAEEMANKGEQVILVRKDTTPEDIHGMKSAVGILTSLGGMTSHAAVVARGMGRCCVSGCGDITVDVEGKTLYAGDRVFKEHDIVTVDGTTGNIYEGEVPRLVAGENLDFQQVLNWADFERTLKVYANADTPENARDARRLGAEGIGLCRTEHMFFDADRISEMRAMILSETDEEKQRHLDRMFEFQKADIKEMLRVMDGLPVTVRLLDPPLHEFLPHGDEEIAALAEKLGKTPQAIKERVDDLKEVNPMLGFRGCRLGVVFPEITTMQARAVITAAVENRMAGYNPRPEIMVPVVSCATELDFLIPRIEDAIQEVFIRMGEKVNYKLGTMMELPRALMTADEISKRVEFLSFGTNDLTQSTYGFSRDDVQRFLPKYLSKGILDVDPFVSIDVDGVGALMTMALEKARAAKGDDFKVGICGEHGGDPKSINFFHDLNLGYVSCSPFRVPIARIAAGQAAARDAIKAEQEASFKQKFRPFPKKMPEWLGRE